MQFPRVLTIRSYLFQVCQLYKQKFPGLCIGISPQPCSYEFAVGPLKQWNFHNVHSLLHHPKSLLSSGAGGTSSCDMSLESKRA